MRAGWSLALLTLAAVPSWGKPTPRRAAPPAAVSPPAGPYLYRAALDKNRQVVVDVDAEPEAGSGALALIFFLYAARTQGHDLFANQYEFDCAKGRARLMQTAGNSKHVEPFVMKDIATQWYETPKASLIGEVMAVACHGRGVIPPAWVPLPGNLRQIAKTYYQTYLGQAY